MYLFKRHETGKDDVTDSIYIPLCIYLNMNGIGGSEASAIIFTFHYVSI